MSPQELEDILMKEQQAILDIGMAIDRRDQAWLEEILTSAVSPNMPGLIGHALAESCRSGDEDLAKSCFNALDKLGDNYSSVKGVMIERAFTICIGRVASPGCLKLVSEELLSLNCFSYEKLEDVMNYCMSFYERVGLSANSDECFEVACHVRKRFLESHPIPLFSYRMDYLSKYVEEVDRVLLARSEAQALDESIKPGFVSMKRGAL